MGGKKKIGSFSAFPETHWTCTMRKSNACNVTQEVSSHPSSFKDPTVTDIS